MLSIHTGRMRLRCMTLCTWLRAQVCSVGFCLCCCCCCCVYESLQSRWSFWLAKRHLLRIGRAEGLKRQVQVGCAARAEQGSAMYKRGNVVTLVFLTVFVVSSLAGLSRISHSSHWWLKLAIIAMGEMEQLRKEAESLKDQITVSRLVSIL